MAEKRLDINGKTITYNTCNARQVYAVIKEFFPVTAKDWTPELVFPFLPTGADASHWCKTLRNVEYNLNKPKRKRSRRQRGPGKPPKGYNPAEDVTRRGTTDALLKRNKSMNYLEEAIVDYLNNNPDKRLDSIDIVSYFKLSADKTLFALKALEDAGMVSRVNGALGGWNGNHYYIVTPLNK